MTKKESDGVLRQTAWPPQSPDLSSAEIVWDEFDCRVKERQPKKMLRTSGNYFNSSYVYMPKMSSDVNEPD